MTFFHPTAHRNQKNYHLPFFRNSDLKCPKMPLSALKFSFFTNYLFFRRDYADTYTYPHTLRFSDTLCLKNALNTFFIKLHSFPLYSFCLPPKHFLLIFRQTSDQKLTKNLPKGGKNFLPFFIIFFHMFPLSLRTKTKPLTFSALFITGNRKIARENVV